jgi:Transglutaminase-like superfamily
LLLLHIFASNFLHMKFPKKTLLFYLIFNSFVWAQKKIDPTPEDIVFAKSTREKYLKDDVAILESKEEISFDFNKKEEKVLVNSHLNERLMNINSRADIQKYEFYNGESSISKFKLTYRNDKDAFFYVQDEFYKDRDLFYNDARVKYIKIDFPVQGYSYNFELEKKYNDVKYFTSIYFNDEYPVLSKEIVVVVPNWLNLELKEFNFEGNKITKTKVDNPKDETTIYTYKLTDIPAISKEDNAPGRSYIYPHIMVIAKSFKIKDKQITLFNSTADLYKWYKSLVDQMKDDTSVMKEKVAELTANAKTDEEKIKNIYYWVQDNIRYIAFEDGIAGFKPDESNNVFTKRYGDCKGMGNLTKQMLKLAGYDARVTWIGTKHIAYDYTTPSLSVDNHMICTLFLKGKKYFLDGTEKYNSFGEYAERIQNKEVMIEDGDKFIIEKIPSVNADSNKEIYKANFVIENEKLKGTCNRTAIGESRAEFLYKFNSFETNKKGETLEKYLSNYDKNIQVENIKTSDLKNRDIKLTMDYTTTISNKVSSFDNDIYVDLDNRKEYKGLELKDRKFNYEFDYKENFESDVTLAIPAGYKVTKLPENLEIKEDNFSVSIKYEQTPKEILYKKSFVFKNGEIKASQLTKWNEFVKKLNKVYNQQITLSKQ